MQRFSPKLSIATGIAPRSVALRAPLMIFAAIVVAPLILVLRRRTPVLVLLGVVALFAVAGCGGGGSGPGTPPVITSTPSGTYTIVVTGANGANSKQVQLTMVVR